MVDKKMRCHVSIILENCWSVLLAGFFLLIANIKDVQELAVEIGNRKIIWIFVILGFLGGILIFQFLRWYKTTIILEEDALTWERATLNKRTLTINIQNISSINLEQNLFQQMLGTSRLKIDTNSLSTANKTDINLLFKKEIAEKLKAEIETKMRLRQKEEIRKDESEGEEQGLQFVSSIQEILLHSIYNISLSGIALSASILAGVISSFINIIEEVQKMDVFGTFGAALVNTCIVLAVLGVIVKHFLTYYNLTVARREKKIVLSYGLLKKREYNIPVETINALIIRQTMIGRIFHRYNATIESIGVGDEEHEIAQLTLSLPFSELSSRLEQLLPEYELDGLQESKPISVKVLWHKLSWDMFLVIIGAVGYMFGHWGMTGEWNTRVVRGTLLGILCFLILINTIRSILAVKTEKIGFGKNYVAFTTGGFGRKITILEYRKIQHLQFAKSLLGYGTGLNSGNVYILSKTSGMGMPMLKKQEIEKLKERCLENHETEKCVDCSGGY